MINNIAQKLPLNDGNSMPGYGFGCYKIRGQELLLALDAAWEAGYRLYDTAAFYENEEIVGQGLKTRALADYFLVSKIWPTSFGQPVKSLDASLEKLGRDYMDGYLLHWPGTDMKLMLNAFEALMREQEKGKIKSLGVSNFLERHLEKVYCAFGRYPAMNQIEIHPWHDESELVAYCLEREIAVMAWAPLGRGHELNDPEIGKIAGEVGRKPAQVILRWQIQGGKIPIPKSVHPERIAENAHVFDFSLSETQMDALNAMDRPDGRTGADPDTFAG